MECKRMLLSVFLLAAQADAIFLQPQHNAADWTPLRTHVPSKDLVNATSLVQIAERTELSLKDELRLRAMRRLQDRLQNKFKEKVQGAASADAGVTDSLSNSKQQNLESSLMDKKKKKKPAPPPTPATPRRRGTGCTAGEYGTLLGMIPNSALCLPEFPNLEMWAGNEGDRCRTKPPATEKLCPNDARVGKGSPERTWSCPLGCTYSGDTEPYCLMKGTRDVCKLTTGCRYPHQTIVRQTSAKPNINKGNYCKGLATNWFPPRGCTARPASFLLQIGAEELEHEEQLTDEEDEGDETDESDAVIEGTKNALKDDLRFRAMHRLQDRLQKTKLVQVQGAASAAGGKIDSFGSSKQQNLESSLMDKGRRRRARRRRAPVARRRRAPVPRRRRAVGVGLPYTWVKSKKGWVRGKVCHVDSPDVKKDLPPATQPDNGIKGFWRLVASSTHGTSVSIETGFTSTKSDTVSKEQTSSFSASVSVTAEVSGSGPVGSGSASAGFSYSSGGSSTAASSASSAMTQSKTEMINVQCPDEHTDTVATTSGVSAVTSHQSKSTEFIYQWIVGNAEYEAKTSHFRCHRVEDGAERAPQCAPQFCGNPVTNPYCAVSGLGQAGADVRCTR